MDVLFSPNGGCEDQICYRIQESTGDIEGLLFMYQSEPIHNELILALANGRNVTLVLDRRQQWIANPRLDELIDAGAICLFDKVEKSIRSQYLICYPNFAHCGSFLWCYTSEIRYAEILVEIYAEWDIMEKMHYDFLFHYDHSVPS